MSPTEIYRQTGRWFGPVVFALAVLMALIGGVTLVCWQAGWWFASHDATRQYQLTQNGTSNQDTLRAQITSDLATVATITTQIAEGGPAAALGAQREAVANIVCSDAGQITGVPLPLQQAQWVARNCQGGAVSPGSSLYQAGQP